MSGKAIGGARCNGNEDGRSEVVGDDVEHLVAAKAAQGVPGTVVSKSGVSKSQSIVSK